MQNDLYSFVIVDDEPEIREGIRDTIPWQDLGFRFAGSCADGNEALELAERLLPDVVMTDINMPFMDGLALSERLVELSPATKVLIISGYDDFEYARKALTLQVYDYIVKPVTPAEFKSVLAKLKNSLDEERAARRDMERIKAQLEESLPVLRERFLNRLVQGKIALPALAERIAYFALPISAASSACQCLILDFTRRGIGETFDIDLISERNLLESFVAEELGGILFQDGEDRLTVILQGERADLLYREGLKAAESLRLRLMHGGMDGIAIGVGDAAEGLSDLPRSYADAGRSLQMALLRGKSGVVAYRELGAGAGTERKRRGSWGKEIASALRISDLEAACAAINGMVNAFRSAAFDIEDYKATLQLAFAAILQGMDDLDIPAEEIFSASADPFEDLKRLKSLDEVRSWFAAVAESIVAYTGGRQENFAVTKVREALEYIERHYGDPELSLQGLCKELYISTSYFSAVFRKYHGRTFVEQLTELRIGKAKELLRTTALKTYEIAERTGYRDAHYFSLSFRKLVSMTPTEYRSSNG